MRVITWDLEIAENIEEHKDGWDAAKRGECGVSSLVLHDTHTERYHIYDAYTMPSCIDHLNSADLLVTFNGAEFDVPCLIGYTGLPIYAPHYDILQAIFDGQKQAKLVRQAHGSWGLGKVCERTLGLQKSGSGVGAPTLYEEGRFAELIDYNLNDVHITRRLANYIHMNGHVIRPDGKPLEVRGPGAPC